jgi:hypothetical protein
MYAIVGLKPLLYGTYMDDSETNLSDFATSKGHDRENLIFVTCLDSWF